MSTQFAFQDDSPIQSGRKHRRPVRKSYGTASGALSGAARDQTTAAEEGTTKQEDGSCAGSLTYSASSSINSGSSAAGESTDSSLADIMRDLDLDGDLAELMKREDGSTQGLTAQQLLQQVQKRQGKSNRSLRSNTSRGTSGTSVTSSLNYSVDGDSSVGMDFGKSQTISGQPSDSQLPDGGGLGNGFDESMFAPAQPGHHSRHQQRNSSSSSSKTPQSKGSGMDQQQHQQHPQRSSASPRPSTPNNMGVPALEDRGSENSSGTTPPTSPPPRSKKKSDDTGGEVWYSQWWMCGFTDSLKFDTN